MQPATAPPFRTRRRTCRPGSALASLALLAALACGSDATRRMQEVRTLQESGRFDASIETLDAVLADAPDLPEANYRLGLALVQLGEPSRAIWPLQKAAASSDYAISAGVLLASTLFQTQNFDQAARAADRVLEVDPERPAALRIRAKASLAARRPQQALIDSERLVALFPDDYSVRALHATVLAEIGRLEEAEREHALLREMGEASGDPVFESRACLAPAIFAETGLRDVERAKVLYDECAAKEPTDPVVIDHLVAFFDRQGQSPRGTEQWRTAVEAAPEDLDLRRGLAARLRAQGLPEEAEGVLREAAAELDTAAAWSLLASFYRAEGEPARALEAIEKTLEHSDGSNERVRFAQADVLIDLGELARAQEIADALEQPVYAALLRGRIHLTRGEPAEALADFDQGIRAWPGNAAARFLAGIAARDLGDYERAISELREAVRADNAQTDAALELARIQLMLGRHQQAVASASLALRGRRGIQQAEPYVIAARALTALGRPERARRSLDHLEDRGFEREALVERMILERQVSVPARAIALAEASGRDLSDPAERSVLAQLIDVEREAGRTDAALAQLDGALVRDPGSAELLTMRGAVLASAGRPDEARVAFDRALTADADRAEAHAGIARLDADAGDTERAIAGFDRADEADPTDGRHAYAAAQLVLASGDEEAAIARLQAIAKEHPGRVEARNDLAWLLAERGEQLDRALALATEASLDDPTPEILDTLGWVHFRRGEYEEAVAVLERAVAGAPEAASMRYRLGLALARGGDAARARTMFESALAAGSFPEAEDARQRLAELAP